MYTLLIKEEDVYPKMKMYIIKEEDVYPSNKEEDVYPYNSRWRCIPL